MTVISDNHSTNVSAFNILIKKYSHARNPARMRCLWEISIRSPLRETSQGTLRNISEEMTFLRRLEDVSNASQKRCLFCDVCKTSQKHLKKDVFCMTSLRCLKHISKKMSFLWHLWDVSKTSLAGICNFSKIPHKMVLCDFRRVTEILVK